ncbi:hypothetical protein PMZ80_002510 [Knufia obscura]|uniref:Zn(2)-C6 fungal-type domain-containing protein n=1 Tax=Knufia obscura TaxID=1635080 RepID=A0ABR0RXI0_9EURO|nr:hypothetical protein PMZ80_002510 [Knufia obscura]
MVENEATDRSFMEVSDDTSTKQAACLECRRSKVKCLRAPEAAACKKCTSAGVDCVVPEYHVGRYKGVKNKRSGLEKAIYQVQEAVKKARTTGPGIQDEHAQALQRLLDESKDSTPQPRPSMHRQQSSVEEPATASECSVFASPMERAKVMRSLSTSSFRRQAFAEHPENSGEVTVNNADNPLQLLAIASAIPEQSGTVVSPSTNDKVSPDNRTTATNEDDETQEFFTPTSSRLDVHADSDPIDLGLVTREESQTFFHDRLSHTRWGLDQAIHTASFVRSRSSFLFSSILAASALFLPDTGALSKRLSNHCKLLVQRIVAGGYRSLEIVLAFMVNVPWMQPGKNWAMDDQTCFYLSTAMTIAIDLSLNRIVVPSPTMRPHGIMEKIAQADCIEAQRALDLDGHTDVDPESTLGRRLLRARERVWMALFTLDRGVCLARGRPWTVPTGPLIDTCDAWHASDIADKEDGSMIASCVLRRDFGALVSSIRMTCDNNQFSIGDGANVVKYMREKVEGFFTNWYHTWSFQIRRSNGSIPPYVEILVSHGKLSAYCNVINHPTASTEMKQFFRAAGLTAALNVIRVAVQNEHGLQSMPNNSVIMVSFAACFVLGLSTTRRGDQIYLAASAKKSIQEAANVLERIGSSPPHRKGASALFGKHIKRIMKQHTASIETNTTAERENQDHQNTHLAYSSNGMAAAPYTLQPMSDDAYLGFPGFDSMTDDQLLAAIQNAKDDIDTFNAGLRPEDGLFMDWLDWPKLT